MINEKILNQDIPRTISNDDYDKKKVQKQQAEAGIKKDVVSRLDADIEKYLANGGEIQELKPFASTPEIPGDEYLRVKGISPHLRRKK